jgi:hypothetical protein
MVCYLERGPGGSTLRRIRLVGAAFDRSWSAPVAGEIGSGSGGSEGAAAVSSVKSGARWVADTLKGLGTSRLDIVCLDGEGGVCTWLSAPSAAQGVVSATIQQSVLSGGEGAGGAAGRLLASGISSGSDSAGFGGDVSVQALAIAEEEPGQGLRLPFIGANAQAAGARERFAVLSMRDAPVRVFLDELDARGIDVGVVESIWHALAATWDPGAPRPGEPAPDRAPVTAVVMTDPAGRLVWAWSAAGELLAAGNLRLRHIVRREERAAAPTGTELAVAEAGTARRIEDEEPDEISGLECTGAEVGRIVMDWLAWSAQLGRVPDRVICFGPLTLPDPDNAGAQWLGGPTPASLAEGLGRAWSGAQIDAAAHEDPLGATLSRLAGVGPIGALPPKAENDDPRRELLGLSSRPGRMDRRMYRWMAVGMLAAAALIAAAGWQFHRAAGGGSDAIADAQLRASEALKSVASIAPNLDQNPGAAIGILQGKITQLEAVNKSLKPQKPILPELARVLRAIEGSADIRVKDINLNAAAGSVRLVVPDGDTGPTIFERLNTLPGAIPWRGQQSPLIGAERIYVLTGVWQVEDNSGEKP